MRYDTNPNRKILVTKIIAGLVILGLLAGGLALVMHLVDRNSDGEEGRFGDTGDWGKKPAEEEASEGGSDEEEYGDENVLIFGDKEYIYTDDIRSYLFIGTDSTGKSAGDDHGEMADFLMLMIINRTQNSYGFIPLNRDTIMDVPMLDDKGEYIGTYPEQLCIAHWYGRNSEERNENTVFAVSNLLGGLEIDGYYAINMDDIGAFNNAIGGVMVTIDGDLTAVDPEFTDGAEVLLSDEQAEKFLRARMSVGEGTNQERMSRQLQYMQAAYGRLINQLRENPAYINDLYAEVQDKVETDRSAKQLSEFAKYIGKSESLGFLQITGEVKEGDTLKDGVQHAEFYPDEKSLIGALAQVITFY